MNNRKNIMYTLAALGAVLLLCGQSPALAAPLVTGTPVQTINTNYAGNPNWFNNVPVNYDSPDGSDLVYLGTDTPQPGINYTNTLLVCDGEVDEMATASWAQLSSPAGFSGFNLFGMELLPATPPPGNAWMAVSKFSTTNSARTGWSNEPVGCAFNPINGHMYVSDDDLMKVFDIAPGADGLLLTADDTRASFPNLTVGNHDPEGLTFVYDTSVPTDATKWALFMVNGVDSEVHRIPALTDGSGQFTGWDLANSTHFDVYSQGVQDPEGIIFDGANGLYVVGKPQTRMIHIYTNGALIRTVDISAFNYPAGPRKPAGLAIAPASNDPLANNVYISSRGVDNNADPNEDDGAVYEVSIPPLGAYPAAVAAGPDMTVFAPNVFQLNGAAVASAGTVTWTQIPDARCTGTLTWGSNGNNAAVTTANFDAAAEGICVLRLSADNDPNNVYDDVTIQVRQPNAGFSTVYVSPLRSTKVYAIPDNPNDPNNTLISVANEDIIAFDTATRTWSMYFKGKQVGLDATGVNVDAFKIMAEDHSILISMDVPVTLPIIDPAAPIPTPLNTLIDDSDIVRFVPNTTCTPSPCLGDNTAGHFELYFQGAPVGLTTDSEDIDSIGFLPSGKLVVSLSGSGSVPGISTVQDEDLIDFSATDLGVAGTAGTWNMHFDGSDVEVSNGGDGEDVMGVWIDSNNVANPDSSDIYLTTKGDFSVTGAFGGGEDIFKCSPSSIGTTTACTYSFAWDGGGNGIATGAVVDGIDLVPNITPVIDNDPPTVSLTAPADLATITGTISVSADATDNVGVVGVQFQLNGANLGAGDATSPYFISWDTTTVTNGTYTLTAVAWDSAGNTTTSSSVSVTVANGDLIPPAVSLTAPADLDTVTGIISVSADATDNVGVAGVQFKLDGNSLNAEDTTSAYSTSWNTTTATNGAHTLTAVAWDANGNTTTSSSVAVTVSNSLATLTFAPTADAAIKFATPANNYGTSTSIGARSNASNTGENFLMKFTVSGIGTRSVVSAKLRLYNKDGSDQGGDFYRVADTSWSESGVTWNNAPAADPTAFASLGTVVASTWYEVNVQPLITGDGVVSLRVQSTSTNWAGYNSKEVAGFVPQLVVTVQ